MKPMANKRMRPRARDWTVVLTMLLGLALFLLFLYHRAERADALTEGRAAYVRGQWSKAADLARERLKSDDKDAAALRLLARSSIRLGRDNAGALIYDQRLGALPLEPEDAFLMGVASSRQGDLQQALRVWSKASGQVPEHPELLLSLANLLARMQRLDEAAALARRLSLIPGWQAAGLLLLGTNRFTMDDLAGAADDLERGTAT